MSTHVAITVTRTTVHTMGIPGWWDELNAEESANREVERYGGTLVEPGVVVSEVEAGSDYLTTHERTVMHFRDVDGPTD